MEVYAAQIDRMDQGIGRILAALPHMMEHALADVPVGVAVRRARHRQAQQGQRIERVRGRKAQRDAEFLRLLFAK